jgi:hypothetical protein
MCLTSIFKTKFIFVSSLNNALRTLVSKTHKDINGQNSLLACVKWLTAHVFKNEGSIIDQAGISMGWLVCCMHDNEGIHTAITASIPKYNIILSFFQISKCINYFFINISLLSYIFFYNM